MKILNLSLDKSVLDKDSALAGRVVDYGRLVERYDLVVAGRMEQSLDLSLRTRAVSVGAGKRKLALMIKIYRSAKRLIREYQYDLITAQDQYFVGLVAFLLARRLGLGLEIQVHGFEKFYGLRKLIAKYLIPRADSVRAVSQRLKRRLLEEFGVEENKITVVPIFVDTNVAKVLGSLSAQSADQDDRVVFLTVGRLVPVKNIGLQLRAMKQAELKMKNTELLIVGEGPELGKLQLAISNLGLMDRVKLLGRQDDLAKLYNQADIFLLTSASEGWGLAVVEAAAYGLPIIMTDVGCAGELIKNNESGIIIPAGDQEKLAAAMLKLAADKQLRERLAAGAQAAVRRLPTKEETLRLYLQSWQRAVNR